MNFYDKVLIIVNEENETYKVIYLEPSNIEKSLIIAENIPSMDTAIMIKQSFGFGYVRGSDSKIQVDELTVALMLEQSDMLDKTLMDCYRAATYYYQSKEAIKLAGDAVYKFATKVAEAMKAMHEYSYTPDDFMDILGICYPEEKDLIANAENLYKKLTIEFIKEEE